MPVPVKLSKSRTNSASPKVEVQQGMVAHAFNPSN